MAQISPRRKCQIKSDQDTASRLGHQTIVQASLKKIKTAHHLRRADGGGASRQKNRRSPRLRRVVHRNLAEQTEAIRHDWLS
ncbi:unnamed protein product [Penicillium camemberti]|uniref:Str. FM013 n=1 Tax=Penicillium camemberti (strain FM 013) TaxID=1429867 RepID=A0A0G4PVW5_PENC3|nr:unnamed protein product [Penicillium camemberti]